MITNSNEYLAQLQAIQNSSVTTYTVAPSSEPRFLINANTRTIDIPSEFGFLAVQHDHKAETIYFEIARYFDHVDLSTKTCIVQFLNKDNKDLAEGYYRVDSMDITSVEDKIVFGWNIENKSTRLSGDIIFSIRFYSIDSNGNFTYNFNTIPVQSKILDTLDVVNSNSNVEPSEFEEWIARLDELDKKLDEKIANLEVGTIDTDETLSVEGKAADAKAVGDALSTVNEAIDDLKKNGGSGEGLSTDLKDTILMLFENAVYTKNMSSTIKRLSQLFSGNVVSYTVTQNLTNVTTSNTNVTAGEGASFITTLTPNDGFLLDKVFVVMNGVDITSSVYTDGKINILSVSGDIVITANAVESVALEPVYQISNTEFDGATYIDTGYNLFDADKDWTMVTTFTGGSDTVWSAKLTNASHNTQTLLLTKYNNWFWRIRAAGENYVQSYSGNVTNAKYIVTKTKGENALTVYSVVDGVKNTNTITGHAITPFDASGVGLYNNLKLGINDVLEDTPTYFTGTINDFKIYNRVLDVTEINEYLGV